MRALEACLSINKEKCLYPPHILADIQQIEFLVLQSCIRHSIYTTVKACHNCIWSSPNEVTMDHVIVQR